MARLFARLKAMWLGPELAAELEHWVFFHDQINQDDVRAANALLSQIPGEGA